MKEGARKKKKGLESFFLFEKACRFVKSLVATAYVDCTAYAPCKQLGVDYTTFVRIAN